MDELIATCACGKVRIKALGPPILYAACYCDDCQAGARMIEALPSAATVLDEWGGSHYLIYRNDRFAYVEGADLLRGIKLKETSPTTRFVATCCNSAMMLQFKPGWWTSLYRARFHGNAPRLELRTQTQHLPADAGVPGDVPMYRGFPLKLFWRLSTARLAMWFGQ
ncbi:MAG TPA: DUF6151 family protein [Rhizomicrobium sp.]|nr:DUF6151 family protein [Rhizomicrobium sp.]